MFLKFINFCGRLNVNVGMFWNRGELLLKI